MAGLDGALRNVTQLVQHTESTVLVPVSGDTRKARQLVNKIASKGLHFYKIVWQYLWLLRPEDLFNGANHFVVDAHYFFPQLIETLTYLPHVQSLESELESSDIR